MSGRVKIKSKDKDKKPKIDVFKIIENRFKNMNELRDLIDMDPKKGLVRIRDGAGFREVERGGWFIVMAELPTGQISNHYENRYWELFNIPELDTAWEWDGHTPNEAADRIESYLKSN